MEGLLAWAADVVGGDSDPGSPMSLLRFTPEQLQEMERLEKQASELERNLQQLRHRLPPANLAHRLPHLHAESLASQSALALELHAHSASRIQAQMRESTLQSDIEAYKKALTATEQQAADRAREKLELESSFQELDELEHKLREECQSLEKDVLARQDSVENVELEDLVVRAEETNELQALGAELAKWQTKLAETRKELSLAESESLAWPSSAQREKDLERRLRSLTEQLTAKQAQAEKLILERDSLELRVEYAAQARRNPVAANLSHAAKRNKISLKHMDPLRQSIGFDGLRRSVAVKLLVLAYVFLLHVIVLIVLSNKRIDG